MRRLAHPPALLLLPLVAGCSLWLTDDDYCDPALDRTWWYADVDEDGFGDPSSEPRCRERQGLVQNALDCDDRDRTVTSAEQMGELPGVTLWFRDRDTDGYGVADDRVVSCDPPSDYTAPAPGDCDDADPNYSLICPWVDVTVGEDWSCGLRSDGSLDCWGSDSLHPYDLLQDGAVALSGGFYVACARYEDGLLNCARSSWEAMAPEAVDFDAAYTAMCSWAEDGAYRCHPAPGYAEWVDVDAPVGPVQTISMGHDFACAVLADGTLHCWGSEPGLDKTPPSGDGWLDVQAGRTVACASHVSGGVTCWGEDPLEEDFAGVPQSEVLVSLHGAWDQICGLDDVGGLTCWGGGEGEEPPTSSVAYGAVDVSSDHGCGVTDAGDMVCWGADDHGQATVPDRDLHGLDLDGSRSCALRVSDRTFQCWGDGPEPVQQHADVFVGRERAASLSTVGQMLFFGDDNRPLDFLDRDEPYSTLAGYSSPSGADEALCAVHEDGRLQCWTEDLNAEAYADLPTGGGFVDVAPGGLHGCALDDAGQVHCWSWSLVSQRIEGAPTDGGWVDLDAAAFHTCGVHGSGALACWGEDVDGALSAAPLDTDFVAVSAHDRASCALHVDGRVSCWGAVDSAVVASTPGLDRFAAVSVAHDQACGLREDGTVACWGDDRGLDLTAVEALRDVESLALGFQGLCAVDGDGRMTCLTPDGDGFLEGEPALDPPADAERLAVGGGHLCAIRLGRVQCWGDDSDGQASPPPLVGVVDVVAGGRHGCALDASGAAHCWGANDQGQSDPPPGTFTELSAGHAHTCGVDAQGAVACWGDLEEPPPLSGATAVSSGREHACALASGEVHCWGSDALGQASAPEGRFTTVAAGSFHTCALDEAGVASCWGADAYRQRSGAPPFAFLELAAGGEHTCGIKVDGFAACWGRDLEGQATPPSPLE